MEKIRTSIYAADTRPLLDKELFNKIYMSVKEERRSRTDRLRFNKDKCLSLGAEYLLMYACRCFGIDYYSERIIYGEHSKPAFEQCPLQFNLSHSGERVMCIMSDRPAGCDVEEMRTADIKLAERFFTADEYRRLCECGTEAQRQELFFRLWTLKESFMKCTGLGFGLPMNRFSVLPGETDTSPYSLFEYSNGDGYRYAWCILGEKQMSGPECFELQWIKIE